MELLYHLHGSEAVTGQITPRDPGAGQVDDALDDLPLVTDWMPSTPFVRGRHPIGHFHYASDKT